MEESELVTRVYPNGGNLICPSVRQIFQDPTVGQYAGPSRLIQEKVTNKQKFSSPLQNKLPQRNNGIPGLRFRRTEKLLRILQ